MFFMTRDLTYIEASDKKFPLVCTVRVLQGDHLVQIFYYTIHSLWLQEWGVDGFELEIYKFLGQI